MMLHAALYIALLATMAGPSGSTPLLYAPFDGTTQAATSRGTSLRSADERLQFGPGVRGQAVGLSGDCRFESAGNFHPTAGTIGVWVRPQWPAVEPASRYLFCL